MTVRSYIPGSQWVYFKLYTGKNSSDQLIVEHILPFVKNLQGNNVIDKFFFIRYVDSDYHIRLRFHMTDKTDFSYLFNMFYEKFDPLLSQGFITDIQLCTYKRELERYGIDTMDSIENLFYFDSQIVISLITYISSHEDGVIMKLQSAMYVIDYILSCFDKEEVEKEKIIASISGNFLKEFGFTSSMYTDGLNKKYRKYRTIIDRTLDNPPSYILESIKEHNAQIKKVIIDIIDKFDKNNNIDNLIGSIIHMFMNRLFQTNNRLYELTIYYFLYKKYKSNIGIVKAHAQ